MPLQLDSLAKLIDALAEALETEARFDEAVAASVSGVARGFLDDAKALLRALEARND